MNNVYVNVIVGGRFLIVDGFIAGHQLVTEILLRE
jgi:hypothetical protein